MKDLDGILLFPHTNMDGGALPCPQKSGQAGIRHDQRTCAEKPRLSGVRMHHN